MACNCCCGGNSRHMKLTVRIGGAIFVALLIVAAVVKFSSKSDCPKVAPQERTAPLTSQEASAAANARNAALVSERMNDPVYMEKLGKLQSAQNTLAAQNNALMKKYSAWEASWLSTNSAAAQVRARLDALLALDDGSESNRAAIASTTAEMDALVGTDAVGAKLLEEKKKITEDSRTISGAIAGTIGERILSQRKSHTEIDEENMKEYARRQAVGLVKAPPVIAPVTNKPYRSPNPLHDPGRTNRVVTIENSLKE